MVLFICRHLFYEDLFFFFEHHFLQTRSTPSGNLFCLLVPADLETMEQTFVQIGMHSDTGITQPLPVFDRLVAQAVILFGFDQGSGQSGKSVSSAGEMYCINSVSLFALYLCHMALLAFAFHTGESVNSFIEAVPIRMSRAGYTSICACTSA